MEEIAGRRSSRIIFFFLVRSYCAELLFFSEGLRQKPVLFGENGNLCVVASNSKTIICYLVQNSWHFYVQIDLKPLDFKMEIVT